MYLNFKHLCKPISFSNLTEEEHTYPLFLRCCDGHRIPYPLLRFKCNMNRTSYLINILHLLSRLRIYDVIQIWVIIKIHHLEKVNSVFTMNLNGKNTVNHVLSPKIYRLKVKENTWKNRTNNH